MRTTVLILALLHAGCATTQLPARYGHCADLGTLRLAATSANEAEDRMRAQVNVLGGDLLLFNARAHAESDVPPLLAQRRNALAGPAGSHTRQPASDAMTAGTVALEQEATPWYYGVALRCNADVKR